MCLLEELYDYVNCYIRSSRPVFPVQVSSLTAMAYCSSTLLFDKQNFLEGDIEHKGTEFHIPFSVNLCLRHRVAR